MAFLNDKNRQALEKEFQALQAPVKLLLFTQELDCQTCRETKQLLEELATLSEHITLETCNIYVDRERATEYGVDKTPAIVVMNGKDYGIRHFGSPAGYEFGSLIEDILMVSQGDAGLKPETLAALARVDQPVHFQVFVTPTCPYCPRAALLAHKFAMQSELIRADVVEANEFPELSQRYGVMSVPRIVINDEHFIEGALPEPVFALAMLEALGKDTSDLEAALAQAEAH